jgi:hypothetical protein
VSVDAVLSTKCLQVIRMRIQLFLQKDGLFKEATSYSYRQCGGHAYVKLYVIVALFCEVRAAMFVVSLLATRGRSKKTSQRRRFTTMEEESFGDLALASPVMNEALMDMPATAEHDQILRQHHDDELEQEHALEHPNPDLVVAEQNNKRTHDQEDEEDQEENDFKRLKLADGTSLSVAAAAKKVNHEQWDAMFDKLNEYKRVHGVSPHRSRKVARCRRSLVVTS